MRCRFVPKVNITIHETVIKTCELAAILGKTTSWIRQLTRDGVFKQVARGKYVLAQAVQDYNEHSRCEVLRKMDRRKQPDDTATGSG